MTRFTTPVQSLFCLYKRVSYIWGPSVPGITYLDRNKIWSVSVEEWNRLPRYEGTRVVFVFDYRTYTQHPSVYLIKFGTYPIDVAYATTSERGREEKNRSKEGKEERGKKKRKEIREGREEREKGDNGGDNKNSWLYLNVVSPFWKYNPDLCVVSGTVNGRHTETQSKRGVQCTPVNYRWTFIRDTHVLSTCHLPWEY